MIIDSREDSKLCRAVLMYSKAARVEVVRKFIEVGDYINNKICIEAKSINDFYYSMKEKRMLNQISNMEDNYEKSIVVVHGRLSDLATHLQVGKPIIEKMKRRLLGAMAMITLSTKTKVVWIPNYKEAAEFIVACFYNEDKEVNLTKMLPKKKRTDDVRIDILTQIKGITNEKAKKLLEEFGSLSKIASSDVKTLTKIEKIGKKTAENLKLALNSENEVIY